MLPADLARVFDTLDADELALAVRLYVQEKNLVDTSAALGWTPWRVDRVRKRLARKMGKLADRVACPDRVLVDDLPTHSIPHYREKLASGRRIWSMGSTTDAYRAMVIDALNVQVIEKTESVQNTPRSGALRVKFDLQQLLIEAERNLERLLDESETAERAARVIEAEFEQLQAKAKSVEAVLAGQKPRPATAEIEQLRGKLETAQETCRIYRLAIDAARQNVDKAKGSIAAHQQEIDRAAFTSEIRQWDAAVGTLLKAHQAIADKLQLLDRGVYLSEIFFPIANVAAIDWRAANERGCLMQIYNAAVQLYRMRQSGEAKLYDRSKEVAA